jgi:hypothetical protein
MWAALSDEKSGQYFSVFAGHLQCRLFQICDFSSETYSVTVLAIEETPEDGS